MSWYFWCFDNLVFDRIARKQGSVSNIAIPQYLLGHVITLANQYALYPVSTTLTDNTLFLSNKNGKDKDITAFHAAIASNWPQWKLGEITKVQENSLFKIYNTLGLSDTQWQVEICVITAQ